MKTQNELFPDLQPGKMTAEHKAIIAAYNETGGRLKIIRRKAKPDSELPLFDKGNKQQELF